MKWLTGLVAVLVAGTTLMVHVSTANAAITEELLYLTDGKLWTMSASGGTPTEVVSLANIAFSRWSRDGRWITFSGGNPYNSQVYVIRPDGSGFRRVTDGSGDYHSPSFSPDGTKLAFGQVGGHIYTIDVNGTGMTDLGFSGHHPEWSPNGDKIAYTNWGLGTYNSDIFSYDLATGITQQITHHGSGEAFNSASWSPTGTLLAVGGFGPNGHYDIYRVNADGSGDPVILTPEWPDTTENFVSWSPEGHLFFGRSLGPNGEFDIWAMNPDGSEKVPITNTPLMNEIFVSATATIPEPSTLIIWSLLGTLGIGVGWWRRRKRLA